MKTTCEQCPYHWKDAFDLYPSCHADPNWPAPCEEEEYPPYGFEDCDEYDDCDDECGFDPYLGCYTDDC